MYKLLSYTENGLVVEEMMDLIIYQLLVYNLRHDASMHLNWFKMQLCDN